MSNFVSIKQYSQDVLVFCFNWAKSAAEMHRMLLKVYSGSDAIYKSCREWFSHFKIGDINIEDKAGD